MNIKNPKEIIINIIMIIDNFKNIYIIIDIINITDVINFTIMIIIINLLFLFKEYYSQHYFMDFIKNNIALRLFSLEPRYCLTLVK